MKIIFQYIGKNQKEIYFIFFFKKKRNNIYKLQLDFSAQIC